MLCFFDANTVEGLTSELPNYTALAEDVSSAVVWWKDHETEIPKWATSMQTGATYTIVRSRGAHVQYSPTVSMHICNSPVH